jgi:hypothetical protein
MKYFFSLIFLTFTITSFAAIKIPKKIRGEYQCVIPGKPLQHGDQEIEVAPANVVIIVYQYRIDLQIDNKLFIGEAKNKKSKTKDFLYEVDFGNPFGKLLISINRKRKTATIDYIDFKDFIFKKRR